MKCKIYDKYYKSTESLLYNYNGLKLSIKSMTDELKDFKDGVAGMSYDGIQTSETFKVNKIIEELAVTNISDKETAKRRIRKMKNCLKNIDRAMDQLPEMEATIIREKYINCNPWYKIAYMVHVSERHCRRIKGEAISKIAVSLYGEVAIKELEEI